jgi:hypothetical protein
MFEHNTAGKTYADFERDMDRDTLMSALKKHWHTGWLTKLLRSVKLTINIFGSGSYLHSPLQNSSLTL